MDVGPIQLIAVAFDSVDKFQGQIRRELDELRGHGLIRILDLLFIMKEADGTIHSVQTSDLHSDEAAELGALLSHLVGIGAADESEHLGDILRAVLAPEPHHGLGLEQIRALAAEIPAGKAAALLLVEHAWAIGLDEAVASAGGYLVEQGFLTRDAMLVVGQEMNAIVEAEVAIERAEAIRGAALLDALTTVAAAEDLKQAAVSKAVATLVGVDALRTSVAAEAVRALVVAGLLEESDAPEAIEVLVSAELITEEALAEAERAADTAAAELAGVE